MSGNCWAVQVGTLTNQHFTILDIFVGEVISDVHVLGTFTSAYDVISPFNARGDFHMIGDLLYSMTMPDVDLRDELLPHTRTIGPLVS